jgi:hypothetical protein
VGPAGPAASYAGVKYVVSSGQTDGINTFSTLSAAIKAIGPNSNGRYAIILMPGSYQENFSFLNSWNVRYNIDVIGQSRSGSIIVPTNNPWNNYSNYKSCIRVSDGMVFKNLTVNGIIDMSSTIDAKVVDVDVNGDAVPGDGVGIMSHYPQKITIENVNITSSKGGMWLYHYYDVNNIIMSNIRINLTAPGVVGIWVYPSEAIPLKFNNVTISGSTGLAFSFFSYESGLVELDHVTINGQLTPFGYDNSGTIAVNARYCNLNTTTSLLTNGVGNRNLSFTIDNSVISNSVSTLASPIKVGNSKIVGQILPSNGLLTTVNSYDGNYQPIPNVTQ